MYLKLCAALCLAVMLSACGSSDDSGNSAAAAKPETAEQGAGTVAPEQTPNPNPNPNPTAPDTPTPAAPQLRCAP